MHKVPHWLKHQHVGCDWTTSYQKQMAPAHQLSDLQWLQQMLPQHSRDFQESVARNCSTLKWDFASLSLSHLMVSLTQCRYQSQLLLNGSLVGSSVKPLPFIEQPGGSRQASGNSGHQQISSLSSQKKPYEQPFVFTANNNRRVRMVSLLQSYDTCIFSKP